MHANAIRGLKIAIVGGSIAGCSAGVLLHRLGAKIEIFERSLRPLEGRGAGIVLPEPFIKQCTDINLFDVDIPRLKVLSRSFFVKDKTASGEIREIWKQPSFSVSTLNWADIYQNLRKRIPDDCYHSGEAITQVDTANNTCHLVTAAGKHFEVDMVIAADGVDSIIRKKLLPEVDAEYTKYIAWRGLIDNPDFVSQIQFYQNVPYYVFGNGHLLLYCIPSIDFQKTGKKILNWVFYEDCRDLSLKKLLVDNKGIQRSVSLPPGTLTLEHIQHLHEFAKTSLPASIADIICQTEQPFLQAVFDLQVPSYVKDKICLIGDAASILRPHTASGALKAIQDSIQLAQAFEKSELENSTTLLDQWNKSQLAAAEEQVSLARNMGAALVTHPPKWEEMNDDLMNTWWRQVMSGKKWYATDEGD